MFRLSDDFESLQLDTVYEWLSGSYWSPNIRREVLEKAFRNSIFVGAYDEESSRQVGIARAVTDHATFAWLCDVFVDPDYRGQGIAQAMVQHLIDRPDLQTLRRWCLATRDAHGVYQPLGFQPVPEGNWLELRMPTSNWQTPSDGTAD